MYLCSTSAEPTEHCTNEFHFKFFLNQFIPIPLQVVSCSCCNLQVATA